MTSKPEINVDIDGTLIITNFQTYQMNVPNLGLVQALQEKHAEGHPINLHTGGDPEQKKRRINELQGDEGAFLKSLPIKAKEDSRGKMLDITVDDDTPRHLAFTYGIQSKQHVSAVDESGIPIPEAAYYRTRLNEAIAALAPVQTAPSPAAAPVAAPSVWRFPRRNAAQGGGPT